MSEEIFVLTFYQAGSDNPNEVNGDIGFKEIELEGAITPANSQDYQLTLMEIMDMVVEQEKNMKGKRAKRRGRKGHEEDFPIDGCNEFEEEEQQNYMQNELEKLKFQDDDLDVYIVEAKEVKIADEHDQTLNDELADDSSDEEEKYQAMDEDLPAKTVVVKQRDSGALQEHQELDEEVDAPFDPVQPFIRCYKMKKTFLMQNPKQKLLTFDEEIGSDSKKKGLRVSVDRSDDVNEDEVIVVRNPMDRCPPRKFMAYSF